MVIEITATGIDALTVSPTLSTRYNDEAPKMTPRIVPIIRGSALSSGKRTDAGMNGRKDAANGLVGLAPTTSGYSIGGFAFSTGGIRSKHPEKARSAQAASAAAARPE